MLISPLFDGNALYLAVVHVDDDLTVGDVEHSRLYQYGDDLLADGHVGHLGFIATHILHR